MGRKESAIFEGLNPEQEGAVRCVDGPVLIVAGAGSGKTRVLTSRIANLLQQGCKPERILALTFTKKAADEMKERIATMVGKWNASRLNMGTFHAMFIRILRAYAQSMGYPSEFTIYDTNESTSLIKSCIKELKLDDKIYKPKKVLSRISLLKNNLVTAQAYSMDVQGKNHDNIHKMPRFYEIYSLYCIKCKQSGVMDFDDILLNMNILLKDNPQAEKEIAERFSYILVDEYQDTNASQYIILKRLSRYHRNICVVGDDSQSIYAFRGAQIQNILNFQKDYQADCKTFYLKQNYRSTQTIVNAANSLIAKNSNRIPKDCFSNGEKGAKIDIFKALDESEEASLISASIVAKIHKYSAQYQDFAILYRTNRQSRALEEALRKRNIPYRIYSGNSFFDRAEVKDMMAYFKLVLNNNDNESFRRAVNKPARGIGETTLAALTAAASENNTSLFNAVFLPNLENYGMKAAAIRKLTDFVNKIKNLSAKVSDTQADEMAKMIFDHSGLFAMYALDTTEEGKERLEHLDELRSAITFYIDEQNSLYLEELQAHAEADEDFSFDVDNIDYPLITLGEYIENALLLSTIDEDNGEDTQNRVVLMTVHSAKGLEFPYVFVAGVESGLFPLSEDITNEIVVEEERRLFYVAMTRAKKDLTCSYCLTRMRFGQGTENSGPSIFLNEIDKKYLSNPEAVRRTSDSNLDSSWQSSSFWGRGAQPSSYSSSRQSFISSRPSNSVSRPSGFSPKPSSSVSRPSSIKPLSRLSSKPAIKPLSDDFIPTPICDLRVGDRVEHNRFGVGKILSIEYDSTRTRVNFDEYGEKILILTHARIRKV